MSLPLKSLLLNLSSPYQINCAQRRHRRQPGASIGDASPPSNILFRPEGHAPSSVGTFHREKDNCNRVFTPFERSQAHTSPWATFPFPNWYRENPLLWCWIEPADAVQHPLEHFPGHCHFCQLKHQPPGMTH